MSLVITPITPHYYAWFLQWRVKIKNLGLDVDQLSGSKRKGSKNVKGGKKPKKQEALFNKVVRKRGGWNGGGGGWGDEEFR